MEGSAPSCERDVQLVGGEVDPLLHVALPNTHTERYQKLSTYNSTLAVGSLSAHFSALVTHMCMIYLDQVYGTHETKYGDCGDRNLHIPISRFPNNPHTSTITGSMHALVTFSQSACTPALAFLSSTHNVEQGVPEQAALV